MLAGDVMTTGATGTDVAPAVSVDTQTAAESGKIGDKVPTLNFNFGSEHGLGTTEVSNIATKSLIIIAADVPDLDRLVSEIGSHHEMIVLDPMRPGLDQISDALRYHQGLQALHVISHGRSGAIQIGNTMVDLEALERNPATVSGWSKSLSTGADVLLYGCHVGEGVVGERFIRRLSQLTGADVAASTDVTGTAKWGGDWDLERSVGRIESRLVITRDIREHYDGILPIVISAAGSTNTEQMELQIDGQTVATFDNIAGDASTSVFADYTYNVDGLSPDQIRVVFTNDLIDPITGADRNLRIDKITVDSVPYETESPVVYSTGTWSPADGLVPGFRESEYLHADGYFQYAGVSGDVGSRVQIQVAGSTGLEDVDLLVDGNVVRSWSAIGQQPTTLSYISPTPLNASQIEVAFTNDAFDPATGTDNNLIVDSIEIDSAVFETESPLVFSSGSWQASDGIVPGFRGSEYLNTNGVFRYFEPKVGQGSTVTVFAAGSEGDEEMVLLIKDEVVARWENVASTSTAYSFTSNQSVAADDVRVRLSNDSYDPVNGIDRNLIVDRIEIDGEVYQTEDPSVFSTGTWLPDDGVAPGFRESEWLHANGDFQYAGQPVVGGGVLSIETEVFVSEQETTVQIPVFRTGDLSGVVSVDFTVSSNDADSYDFGTYSGTITFVSGQAEQAIAIPLGDDNVDEPSETLQVTLSNPTGTGLIGSAVGEIRILDDDQATLAGQPLFQRDGHLYLLTSASIGWSAAQLEAEALGGNLVTINDAAEESWLRSTFGTQAFWIGLNDIDEEGVFEWSSGEPVTYTNWAPGKPNSNGNEDFVEMNFDSATGGWNDNQDPFTHFGIIEIGSPINDDPLVPNGTGFATELIADGLNQPISFAEAADGRIFVAEKEGRVIVIENGQVAETFLDINEEVNSHHDRGLLGIALDPDFVNNGYVYIQYSVELDPENPDAPDFNSPAGGRLVRYTESASDANKADLSSRLVIQDGHQLSHATHSVGDIDFDNDGNLILTWGDGGFDNDLRMAAQDPTSPQGKLFRIDPVTFQGVPDNPFYDPNDPGSIQSRVWALGVRNSWKLTVDRDTGDVYIGEVTDEGPEEINVLRAVGPSELNFGWPYFEGDNRTSYGTLPPNFQYDPAFIELPHTNLGSGDSILGGAVFRGDAYPDVYDGRYFFGNFNQGTLYSADAGGNYQPFGQNGDYQGIVDLQLGSDGHLWALSVFSGELRRIVYQTPGSGNTDPTAIATSTATAGVEVVSPQLDALSSSDADGDTLLYTWDFDSDGQVDQLGATVQTLYDGLGRTTSTLLVSDGRGGTDTDLVEIDVVSSPAAQNNLAFGRPATQSGSTAGAIASRAVDGGIDPIFVNGSVTQTLQTRTPLWEVDLGADYELQSVEITSDPAGIHPLANFWVLVSQTPFSSGNLDAARNDPGVTAIEFTGDADAVETIGIGTLGRYVRIQMAGVNDILSLVEVVVLEA